MLHIKNLCLQLGGKTLFSHADLTVYPREKIALTGRNGTGKSTLFALIAGTLLPDEGEVSLPADRRIAQVSQQTPSLETSALDYVLQGDADLQNFQTALRQAEDSRDGMAIAEAHRRLEEIDAYGAPARAAKLLAGLGFAQDQHAHAVRTFSGGWRMRLNLAQALMCRADLLLLDEPTNHLDLETVLWLENHLRGMDCTQLIISHDRDFLNAATDKTCELAAQKLTLYGGNYDFFQKERAQRLAQQQSAYTKQQAHIRHMQSFIDRFRYKATKARQAQSRIKALEKLELIAPAHWDSPLDFSFAAPDYLPNPLIKLENADLGYAGGRAVLHAVDFSVENGARYGLLGVNGSGKSTLIKSLVGEIPLLSGSLTAAEKLKTGYFAQHQLDVLRADQSPLWHIRRLSPDAREQEIRDFLGSFAFRGDAVNENIAPFSGGEKARLALALLVWQKPNFLLLDEPTNHLDLDMRHALSLALQSFQGALIVVSHDRSLLETVCDSFLLIDSGSLKTFDGDLEDYRRLRLGTAGSTAKTTDAAPQTSRKDEKRRQARRRQAFADEGKSHRKIIEQSEKNMTLLDAEKNRLEAYIASEEAYNPENKNILDKTLQRLAQINQELPEAENAWFAAQEALETLKARLEKETE